MNKPTSLRAQRGATLVTGLILMTLLMLSVSVAFLMSNNNLKAVGNMQSRAEAAAAAEAAVEKLLSSAATFLAPAAVQVPADAHGVSVTVSKPVCVRSVPVEVENSADSNPNLYQQDVKSLAASGYVTTHWDLQAVASSGATGAKVEVHQGVKIVLPADPDPCPL